MKFPALLVWCICILLAFPSPVAAAIHPDERMQNPAMEARAQDLYDQLRCTVCQNQSIADSDADIAADLRRLVRRQIESGQSDSEILEYIHSRYGDFVLMRPPFSPQTWALWLAPLAILLGGLLLCVKLIRSARA